MLGDSQDHARWLVSYSDFMTLLFGFFVVMYAISSVNEGKYKILSDSLTEVFNQRARTLTPIQVGEPVQSSSPSAIDFEQSAGQNAAQPDSGLEALQRALGERLTTLLKDTSFSVSGNGQWLEVNLDADVLFASGSADPSPLARDVIAEVVSLLEGLGNPITVEGYTDNVPIASSRYPSNWELSAARASAVARALVARGIGAERLAAVGYGENHPIATNATPEGRSHNRRVTLVVPQDADVQRGLTAIGADRAPPVGMTWSNEHDATQPDPTAAPRTDAPEGSKHATSATAPAVQAIRRKEGGVLFTNERPPVPEAAPAN